MQELNYEEDMQIDEGALDVEWLVTQGQLANKYNNHYAICCKKYAIAHEEVKTIRSGLIRKANEDPNKCCNKPKPNAQDIEAYYRTHVDYINAVQEKIELEYEKNMAEMAKNEINFTRKAALENAVQLLGLQYFSGPSTQRNIIKEATKRREQLSKLGQNNQSKISKALKRKTLKKTKHSIKRKKRGESNG